MQKLKDTFAGFWKYRYLLQNLISRDFKLKYRRSVLGVAWSVLNPLLTCLVMWAVFGALFNQRGQGIEDFPLFLIIGQLMFNFFRESTTMAKAFILVPGYGAQGGKGADLVHFFNEDGLGAIINSSRGIIAAYQQEKYAQFGEQNYADASRAAVLDMREDIAQALAAR